jgi:squalene-hopene/tetraprenyl-beta-curcumene cyclase
VAVIVLLRFLPSVKNRNLQEQIQTSVDRAINWLLGMQNKNGGWAAFDKDNTSRFLTLIPFADFGELLDPPSVDVTAHVVEALGMYGCTQNDPVVVKACRFIRTEQENDGPWFGRWGVNYIYGTAAVLPALKAVGEDLKAGYIQRAVRWLVDHQNADGGWGECCGSYMDDQLRGRGPSTASQTGWALMALTAVDSHDFNHNISSGLEFLLTSQRHDGTWDEPYYTATGFPGYGVGKRINLSGSAKKLSQGQELSRGFMLNYNLYRHYFPLMAMGRTERYLAGKGLFSPQ